MSINKRKRILKENQLVIDAVKLLKCDTGRITKLKKYFFIAGYYNIESIYTAYNDNDFKLIRFKIIHENCVASGKDLDSLWKSILEYNRLSNMSTNEYMREMFHCKMDDAIVYKEICDGGVLWQL